MNGFVKNVMANKNYGFVRGEDGKEYFFHREEYKDDWDSLATYMGEDGHHKIEVEFDVVASPKGPRAGNVRLVTE